MTYYAERKSIKTGISPTTVNKYGTHEDMEYQYCLFRASAVKNEADNDIDAIEWGTVERGVIERKIYMKSENTSSNEEENQETSSAKNSDKKTISEYEGYDEINNNENPFYDDPDAPEGCIKRKIKHHKKKFLHKIIVKY